MGKWEIVEWMGVARREIIVIMVGMKINGVAIIKQVH
jgi:hypothetical protein